MTSAAFVRAKGVNLLRRARALLRRPPQAPAPRALAARRALDRLLILATAASLLAAVLERRDRTGSSPASIPSFPVNLAADPPERLRLLPGLGPTRLAALLRERERSGAPSDWGALEQVRGIGAKTLSAWRASGATVGPPGHSDRAGEPGGAHAR